VARADGVAAAAGFRAGDRLVSLAGQPLLSIADVQWVLETARAPAKIPAVVERKGARVELSLPLPKDWRRGSDISWRTTTWDLRRMAFGGMILEPAPGGDGKSLRLRVKHVGRYGQHAVAMKAGVRKGDLVVAFAGWTDPMTESEMLARVLTEKPRGTRVPVVLVRGDKRIETTIRLQ
jgi:S1-C subfamily serine protease